MYSVLIVDDDAFNLKILDHLLLKAYSNIKII